jgi:hypothetical protein
MQFKITMIFLLMQVRMAITKNDEKVANADKDVEKRECSYIDGSVNISRNSIRFSEETKKDPSYDLPSHV